MIYRGPLDYVPDVVESPVVTQQRLDYLAACTLLDEAVQRFVTEKEKAAV